MSLTNEQLESLTPDLVVDAIGEVCPHTLNMAIKALEKVEPGQIVVEVTDHSIATKTIPAAMKMNKYGEILGIVDNGGEYKIYIKKL